MEGGGGIDGAVGRGAALLMTFAFPDGGGAALGGGAAAGGFGGGGGMALGDAFGVGLGGAAFCGTGFFVGEAFGCALFGCAGTLHDGDGAGFLEDVLDGVTAGVLSFTGSGGGVVI